MMYIEETRGAALVLMLFTMAIISLVGITLTRASLQEYQVSHLQEDTMSAQYLAEGGLQKALVMLKNNPHWDAGIEDGKIISSDGSYRVGLKRLEKDLVEVTSWGKYKSAKKPLKALVKVKRTNTSFANELTLNSDALTTLSGRIRVEGSMYSHSDLQVNGDLFVSGDMVSLGNTTLTGHINIGEGLYSRGDIVLGSTNNGDNGNTGTINIDKVLGYKDLKISSHIDGKIKAIKINGTAQVPHEFEPLITYGGISSQKPIKFPAFSEEFVEDYRTLAQNSGRYFTSATDPEFTGQVEGITFIDSAHTLTRPITGDGILFINDSIILGADLISDPGGAVVLIVNGNTTLHAQSADPSKPDRFQGVLLSSGKLILAGYYDLYGSIVAKDITGAGDIDVFTLEDLDSRLPPATPGEFITTIEIKSLTYD